MLQLDHAAMNRAEKLGLLNAWSAMAEDNPQASLEDRLTRAALSVVAIDEAENQDVVMALMRRRSVPVAQYVAAQRVLFDVRLDEAVRRIELEKIVRIQGGA